MVKDIDAVTLFVCDVRLVVVEVCLREYALSHLVFFSSFCYNQLVAPVRTAQWRFCF